VGTGGGKDLSALNVPPDPRPRAGRAVKRGFDVTLGFALLVAASPLLALAFTAIALETRGSPIYRQRRIGKGGFAFDLLKLRTMVSGAESMGAGLAVDEGDPRITRVGALLRRLSLDELPNLLNVLRGEMSLVGPRPTVESQVVQYTERQRGRLAVEPGITGWAQVKGRAALPWSERIELDLWYIEHWSLRLDLSILASTVRLLASGKGLYRGERGGWR
jgi:lipopolysaccharide/colanic/teichoic acid biosynthesis glycosyltransferase